MTQFLKTIKSIEDAFALDCSPEDLKTDKEAKRCYKNIKKYRKHAIKHLKFLRKNGFEK